MSKDFTYEGLNLEMQTEIALKLNYTELVNLCRTSLEALQGICGSNAFWKRKTEYDFGDLYEIERYGDNWWDTYQFFRTAFSLEVIYQLRKERPILADGLLVLNEEREFLDPNVGDLDDTTALIIASQKGYTDIVEKLLEAGADPDVQDKNKNTALIIAANEGYGNIVKMLIDNKADVDIRNAENDTALIIASYKGHEDIVDVLLNANANINIAGENRWTALMQASVQDNLDIVNKLLAFNADTTLKNSQGETAFDIAIEEDHSNIIEALVDLPK